MIQETYEGQFTDEFNICIELEDEEETVHSFSAFITGEDEWISVLDYDCEYAFFDDDVIPEEPEEEEDDDEDSASLISFRHAAIAMAFLVYQWNNE